MNLIKKIAHARRTSQERGTILILAIAVLAVLSLLAVSYVTVVRIDRDSSDAVAVSRDFDQQVGTVVRHMQSLLTADMFGNKVVTTSVPRYTGNGVAVWPSMFEDGEYTDIDFIDPLYARSNPSDAPSFQNGRVLQAVGNASRRVGHPDDAWLASTEPRWVSNGFSGNPYFENFTNLRSAFKWNAEDQRWERGDGLYVDLAQWFLNPIDGRANAGVDLLDTTGSEVTAIRGPQYSKGEFVRQQDGIDYTLQMPQLTPGGDPTILFQNDERFFVDTTGDLRPDAQWTQLEELGNLFGLNWVVAARITDASALVNLNTAIEAPAYNLVPGTIGSRDYAEIVGTGETPADVDLVRLLTYDYGLTVPTGLFVNGSPNLNRILGDGAAFNNHLADGRGLFNVLSNVQDQATPGYISAVDPLRAGPGQTSAPWGGVNQPLTRNQRLALYQAAYSRPLGGYPRAERYPERALLDLHGFWATNNATLISKPEQYLDGPEIGGYLPSATNSPGNGPLRAAEITAPSIRAYGEGPAARPTVQQAVFDNRRLLTTMSGAGRFSPVPVINKTQQVTEFDGIFAREQHEVSSLRTNDAAEVFADMVWALAPFATNQELVKPVQGSSAIESNQASNPDFHYGGGPNGPAQQFANLIGSGVGQIGAAYALHRAGAFTVNLIDAADRQILGGVERERPTVLRFLPTVDFPIQLPLLPGYEQSFANARFAHGDIEFTGSPISPDFIGEDFGGISFIGVDRQPFLVDAHTFAIYQGNTNGNPAVITPDDPSNHVGSLIAIELANPWPDPIQIGPSSALGAGDPAGGYAVRIQRDRSWIELQLPNVTIDSGERRVIVWASESGVNGFEPSIMDTVLAGWISTVEDESDVPGVVSVLDRGLVEEVISVNYQNGGATISEAIPFQQFATQLTGQTQVQLILKADDPAQGSANPIHSPPAPERKADMLVDRLTTISTSVATGDGIDALDFFGGLRETRTQTFVRPDGTRANGNFRVTVVGSMTRPPRRPAGQEGFPAYVVEKPSLNRIAVAGHTDSSGPGTGSNYIQTWETTTGGGGGGGTGPGAGGGGAGGGDVNDPLIGPAPIPGLWASGDGFRIGNDAERPIFQNLPAFQLFNPSTGLSSVANVGLVSAFSHMYLHDAAGFPNSGYSVLRVNEFSTRYNNDVPGFGVNDPTAGRWLTFSEQLGFDFHLDGDPTTPGTIEPNPWFGKIDPTRYRFGDQLATAQGLPDSMAVPVGSRIFDLFFTMSTSDFLTPGQININTAPRRVLSTLPLVEPLQPVQDGSGSGPTLVATPPLFGGFNGASRAGRMYDYRERKGQFGPGRDQITNFTGLTNLRNIAASDNQTAMRGFVTKGELALLGQFQASDGLPVPGQTGTFLEVGANALNAKAPPFETWSDTGRLFSFGPGGDKAYAFTDFNPSSDAEEQLALFRAIANIVSTRSDVFMATFVLRGYDPDVIESIEIPGGSGSGGALQAMNDPLFRPAYESRWLVVFDRSNVRQPTDRPRVLLRMELPSAVP